MARVFGRNQEDIVAAMALQDLGREEEVVTTPTPRPKGKLRGKNMKHLYEDKIKAYNRHNKEGESISSIARNMQVPRTTVAEWVKGRAHGKQGKTGLLTTQEEEWLKDHIKHMARRGHGFDYLTTRYEVGYILERANDERFGQLDQGLLSKLLHFF